MLAQPIHPKRALISVSDKRGITELAQALRARDIMLLSTGGTAKHLKAANIEVVEVTDVTGFPEIMAGRVKTLHPLIFAGLLGQRDRDVEVAQTHGIAWIDLLICNLYPFGETIQQPNITLDQAIENIDIGGPAMLRAAAKNMDWVGVVVDPDDYQPLIKQLDDEQGITLAERQRLATKAFHHTAHYDTLISHYLSQQFEQEKVESPFPNTLQLSGQRCAPLRYGENPSQQAAAYRNPLSQQHGLLHTQPLQGKQLSYNNILDGESALNCLLAFDQPTCVVVKHNTPCGVATATHINDAFDAAWAADSQSAFGGIVALNRPCSAEIAKFLATVFFELLIAPDYTPDALNYLSKKPNLRLLKLDTPLLKQQSPEPTIRSVRGGWLCQHESHEQVAIHTLNAVTTQPVTIEQYAELDFAWQVVKHVKSNAIVISRHHTTLGIGGGQVSRIDAVNLAISKAQAGCDGAVLASDAFFPFCDSIDTIAQAGIKAIIQPGGSIRDKAVIDACNEQGIAMLFTGERCFRH